MKSTLFASTLAAALTATSFGQVDVQLIDSCCGDSWNYTYQDEVLTFITRDPFGFTDWQIQVPEDTFVQFTCSMLDPNSPFLIADSNGPLTLIDDTWAAQGQPSFWTGTVLLPAGNYFAFFSEFQGTINFNYELEAQGSCCVNSGCASIAEAECSEMGGTWTEGGSCDDCEPVADDCPADVDGDGIPDECDASPTGVEPQLLPEAVQWVASDGGNDHFYAFVTEGLGWHEAQEYAESLGAHLATLTGPEEANFVYSILPSTGNEYFAYLGGYQPDNAVEPLGDWTWVTGEAWSFADWSSPNPSDSGTGEDYLEVNVSASGDAVGWNDGAGARFPLPFVLEWSIDDCNSNGIIDSCENVPDDCGVEDDCPADVDGDGSIGFSDVLIILNDWGACP